MIMPMDMIIVMIDMVIDKPSLGRNYCIPLIQVLCEVKVGIQVVTVVFMGMIIVMNMVLIMAMFITMGKDMITDKPGLWLKIEF